MWSKNKMAQISNFRCIFWAYGLWPIERYCASFELGLVGKSSSIQHVRWCFGHSCDLPSAVIYMYVIHTLCTILHWTFSTVELVPIIYWIGKTVFAFGKHCQTFVCLFVWFLSNVPCVTNFCLLFYMKMLKKFFLLANFDSSAICIWLLTYI